MRPTNALPHPPDWSVATVHQAVEIRRGVSWSKDQEHPEPKPDAVAVLRISNIQARLDLSDILYLTGIPERAKAQKKAGRDWTILVGSNGNRNRIGNAVQIQEDIDFLFASFLIGAKPYEDSGIQPDFFFRWLSAHEVQCRLSASSEGSTGLSNLSHDFFKAMEIAFPDREEQGAIVRILDAVDAAIVQSRMAIEKAQRVKRGLMQSVFTKGIEHHDFKQSDIGNVPSTWDVVPGKRAFRTVGGQAPSAVQFARDSSLADAWFMKVDDFNDSANLRRITKTKLGFLKSENPKVETVPIGTIVIAKRGAAIEKNRVRTTAVPIALDPNLMGLQLAEDIDPEFFRFQLEWRQLSRYIESSGVPQLNNKDLYPRLFLKPPKPEQSEIVKLLVQAENCEDRYAEMLTKLEILKRGLMQDLLTGKVRVGRAAAGGSAGQLPLFTMES